MTQTFEPGFLIRVNADLDDSEFREWFFREHTSIGVIASTPVLGRLGLNYIELTKNYTFNPALFDAKNGYLYYRYSIEVLRADPLPSQEELITEQVEVCRHFIHSIEQQNWKYGIIGDVLQYL